MADILLRRCMAGLGPDLGRSALQRALPVAAKHLGWNAARLNAETEAYEAEIRVLESVCARRTTICRIGRKRYLRPVFCRQIRQSYVMYMRLTCGVCWLGLSLLMVQPCLRCGRGSCCRPPGSACRNPGREVRKSGAEADAWIDDVQRGVYSGVCGAASWFDGLFGNPRFDQDSNEHLWPARPVRDPGPARQFRYATEDSGRDSPCRPSRTGRESPWAVAMSRNSSRSVPRIPRIRSPQSWVRRTDDAWLLGLGYAKQDDLEKGFDFGIGVRLRFPVDPYVKATYRHNFIFNDRQHAALSRDALLA